MTTITQVVGTKTALTITLNSLANVTYAAATAVDLTSVNPLDVIVEVELTPGTVAGNKQAKIFVQASLDGTNYGTGPTSGTTVTDEPNLLLVGVLPLGTSATLQRRQFSMAAALGFIPAQFKLVVFNDSGVALAGSGNAANYSTIVGNAA